MSDMSLQSAYELMRDAVSHGEHEKVAGIARHILQYFPQNLKAKLYLGEALIAAGSWGDARAMFEEVCLSDPENIVAQIGLSTVSEREGDLALATKYLERAMEIRPDMGELRPRLLNLYQRTARHDVYLHLSRSGLARLFMRSHAYSQAIPEFHQMAMANPDRRENVVALAEALWRNGDELEAHEICQQVLTEAPQLLKANLINARYYESRDADKSTHYWQQAQAFDPLLETAHELFGGEGVPSSGEWLLPAWDDTEWYVQQVHAKAHSGVRMQYLVTSQMPTLGEDDLSVVLSQMRQMPRMHESDHGEDCACMIDEHETPDRTGVLLQRTLERQAALQTQDDAPGVEPEQPVTPAIGTPLKTTELDERLLAFLETPVTEQDAAEHDPITEPVAPSADEVTTEPVMMSNGLHHDSMDADDRFLASVMNKLSGDDGSKDAADVAPVSQPAATPVAGNNRIDTTTIKTITCSDDLYVLLARMELRQTPAPTEDLRDVVARMLGGSLIERVKVSASAPRDERGSKTVEPVTLETLLDIDSPDALALDLAVASRGEAPPPPTDNLLASLLAKPGSGLTEGMRGLSAALPRASAPESDVSTQVNDGIPDETLTELLSQGMRDGHVDVTDVARASGGDQTTHDALMAMLEDESVIVKQTPPATDVTIPQATPMHEFPMTGAHAVIDVSQVVCDLGLTSGELREVASDMPATPITATAVATPSKGEEKRTTTGTPAAAPAPTVVPDNMAMEGYLRALQDDPENAILRLSVARVAIQCRMYETALIHYRHLIRNSSLLEEITHDLRDILADVGEPQLRRDCSRLLGNAYARQSKVQEAVEAYRMTLNSGSVPLM